MAKQYQLKIHKDFFKEPPQMVMRAEKNGDKLLCEYIQVMLESLPDGIVNVNEVSNDLTDFLLKYNLADKVCNDLILYYVTPETVCTEYSNRATYAYTLWRKNCIQRDNEQCQSCGATDILHVHHIIRWVDNIEKRFDLDNGVTLCRSCHMKLHKEWGK